MGLQFKKHYTLDEARALLPQVRQWLQQIGLLREQLADDDQYLGTMLAAGRDVGGERVGSYLRGLVGLRELLQEFNAREIQIKDLERGLIDFPALRNGREIFLCWELDEEDIEFWHDLDSGFAGRERL